MWCDCDSVQYNTEHSLINVNDPRVMYHVGIAI